ncbi:polysaccharide deacetylase family protein [Altibacter sp. HG106]|uniref:polysaccharide deacetylase family protein n=1 Tax=Altibacter sp. HG106 TaxID=3023937 RepID=UPI002350F2AA|nr:polysaccharide deacetylase family protein [Altibacter sp. HG106]MDC7994718.1 polysaccharide deacetylase family protein [Altibacter sp. HG106]
MWKPVTVPNLLQKAYPKRRWSIPNVSNHIFLTFDDGPIPELTPWVLEQLHRFEAKATFFCIGDNVAKHPKIAQQLLKEGHAIGNHTQHHLNGWKTSRTSYQKEVTDCEQTMLNVLQEKPKYFRPPYGKMTSSQARAVLAKGYDIVMWSILSYDYDMTVSEEACLQNVLNHMVPGSVIVFHDSLKAEKKLRFVLPKVLEQIREKGWKAVSLSSV